VGHLLYVLLDGALLVLATARATRLVTTDTIPGKWWIYEPLAKRVARRMDGPRRTRAFGYLDGLECPFCVGFWIGVVALSSLLLAGGFGGAADWWRVCAGFLALNYVVGHASGRLD